MAYELAMFLYLYMLERFQYTPNREACSPKTSTRDWMKTNWTVGAVVAYRRQAACYSCGSLSAARKIKYAQKTQPVKTRQAIFIIQKNGPMLRISSPGTQMITRYVTARVITRLTRSQTRPVQA